MMLKTNAMKKEVLCDCFFLQCNASPGASPLTKRTEREVRRDSCDSEHTVVAEEDAIHMLWSVVSFQTARRSVAQTSSRIVCDSCRWSVFAVQGCLLSDSGQSQFKQEQCICVGCLMMAVIERWESHECNKPEQLRKGLQCVQDAHC